MLATTLKKAGAVALVTLCAVGTAASASAQTPSYTGQANAALNWMKTQQQPDGSFQGFGAGSTVDAALAIVAAGQSLDSYSNGGNTPLTFLQSKAADIGKTPGGAGKLLILVSTFQQGSAFGGVDLVDTINRSYNPDTGQYGKDVIGDAFAILGLHAIGQAIPARAVEFLKSTQTPEGGWAFSGDTKAGGADTDTTAVVLQALVAAGADKTDSLLTKKAVVFLDSQQNPDGGFAYQKSDPDNSESDVNSTAYAAQALYSTGANTDTDKGLAFIAGLQQSDGGIQWKKSVPGSNAGATYQAVPALLYATLVNPVPTRGGSGSGTGTGTGTGVTPGMPRTGQPQDALLPALAAIAALALGAGVAMRRKTA